MIGRLRGQCVSEDLGGRLLVDVGGVGYEVASPLGTAERARQADGSLVLSVHTHVREDAIELFGFATERERQLFRLLINVPNVGPKTALGVLSALPAAELGEAVRSGDVKRLRAVPGVGQKTAERLVLELKERLLADPLTDHRTAGSSSRGAASERLCDALTSMGYKPAEAERAARHVGSAVDRQPIADSLREALAFLTR